MNEKKKSSSSEDTLMMTDDLLGRLDPESLTRLAPDGRAVLGTETEEDVDAREKQLEQSKFYDQSPEPPRGIPTSVSFDCGGGDIVEFDGTLQLISFGKDGWRVQIDNVAPKPCIQLAKYATRGPAWLGSASIHAVVKLYKDIDVTIHFGNLDETCIVTIAANCGDAI